MKRIMRLAGFASLFSFFACGAGEDSHELLPEDPGEEGLPAESVDSSEDLVTGTQVRFAPIADTEIAASNPNRVFGGASAIGSDGDPKRRIFFRFAVKGISGKKVLSATLRCYANNGTVDGPAIYKTSATWSETLTTWNNAPGPIGSAIRDVGAVRYGTWLNADITSAVSGDGQLDLVLVPTSTDSLICNSREASTNRPELVVTYEEPVASTPDPAPAPADPPPTTPSTPSTPPTTTDPSWKLYFADEFDGTALNTKVWHPYDNAYGSGNHELQCEKPQNVKVANGVLTITAKREHITCSDGSVREFTAGFLGTRENNVYFPRYGRYEMRAKTPHAAALWPAFWLRHKDGSSVTEIDVMEYFHAELPGQTTSTLHYNGKSNVAKGSIAFEEPTRTPDWHVWATEIEEVSGQVCLSYFVDDKRVQFNGLAAGKPYCFTDVGPFQRYPGQNLFDIAVNVSVGGDWVALPDGPTNVLGNGTVVNPKGTVLSTVFPTDYVIDYVRVYTR